MKKWRKRKLAALAAAAAGFLCSQVQTSVGLGFEVRLTAKSEGTPLTLVEFKLGEKQEPKRTDAPKARIVSVIQRKEVKE